MCYFRRACNAVSFWRCLPIMTTLVLHTRVPDNCARSISYPYSIAEVSSCFTAHIHIYDERSIGDTWEQRQMLTWCGFTVALKKGSARGCLYLGKGGGSCQCLWIAVECVWKTWKGNSIPGLLSDGMLISKFVYCNVESHWTNVHLLLHSTAFRSRSFIGSKTVLL